MTQQVNRCYSIGPDRGAHVWAEKLFQKSYEVNLLNHLDHCALMEADLLRNVRHSFNFSLVHLGDSLDELTW